MNNFYFMQILYCARAILKVIVVIFVLTCLLPFLVLYLFVCWYRPLDFIGIKLNSIAEAVIEMWG